MYILQHAGVGRDSFVSRLLEDVGSYDLAGGSEVDLETFIKHLTITIYTGEFGPKKKIQVAE